MKIVDLTRNMFALVDDEDFEKISNYSWCCDPNGGGKFYAARKNSKNKKFYMHREIMNAPKGYDVDHKNGDTLDNRKTNLRICSKSQNAMNSIPRKNKNKSSKFKGVTFDKSRGKWAAQIKAEGKRRYLGRFKKEIDAARAYDKAALKYFGEFSRINGV